jgi:hypothetical protein
MTMGWREYWSGIGGHIASPRRDAAWRARPATRHQLARLREFGMAPRNGLTQGQADAYIRLALAGEPLPLDSAPPPAGAGG